MKLSEVKGERTLDVVAEIIEPIANIAEDPEAAKLFQREKIPQGVSAKKILMDRIKKSVPALIKGHKNDLVTILAAIEGVSPDEYRDSLNLVKLGNDVLGLMLDSAFVELFTQAQSGDSSGSAPENTGGSKA